jgi:hypothetical protein
LQNLSRFGYTLPATLDGLLPSSRKDVISMKRRASLFLALAVAVFVLTAVGLSSKEPGKPHATCIPPSFGSFTPITIGDASAPTRGPLCERPAKQDLLSELIAILNETKSDDTFSVTVHLLAEMGPKAESAIPVVIRNAERLGILTDHMRRNSSESQRVTALTEALSVLVREKNERRCAPAVSN